MSVSAVIGTGEAERFAPRELILDMDLEYDASVAMQSDVLAHALDYEALARKVREFVEQSKFSLLESLASSILDLVLADPKVTLARIVIDKPGAVPFTRSVAVEMSLNREDDHRSYKSERSY